MVAILPSRERSMNDETTETPPLNAVNADQLSDLLVTMYELRRPVMIWGPPGGGQSSIAQQTATERLGIEHKPLVLVYRDITDVNGVPVPVDGICKWTEPDWLPQSGAGMIVIEEPLQAPKKVFNGLSSLLLERAKGDYKLPDGWAINLASNREQDRADVTAIASHIANRIMHVEYMIDTDIWCRHAMSNAFATEVVAFIRFRPALLHAFDPRSRGKAFPSPRTWEILSDIIKRGIPPGCELPVYTGTVGDAAGTEFAGFMEVWRELPSVESVIGSPEQAIVPSDSATTYALCGALARRMTEANISQIYAYLARLDEDYLVKTMLDSIARDPTLQATPTFVRFASEHSHVLQ
jgi:hypothetical protein